MHFSMKMLLRVKDDSVPTKHRAQACSINQKDEDKDTRRLLVLLMLTATKQRISLGSFGEDLELTTEMNCPTCCHSLVHASPDCLGLCFKGCNAGVQRDE